MASCRGVQVRHDGQCYLYTDSKSAIAALEGLRIVYAQQERRLAKERRLIEKIENAAAEMRQRELLGKARNKAPKAEREAYAAELAAQQRA